MGLPHVRSHPEAPKTARCLQRRRLLNVAMHIRSEPDADPVALAHEMISLLRSVRTPAAR